MSDPDPRWEQVLQGWIAENPPPDFARSVAARAHDSDVGERGFRSKRGIVVPLFLAALFFSFAAAAAWGSFGRPALVSDLSDDPPAVITPREVTFELYAKSTFAEPEEGTERQPRPLVHKPVDQKELTEDVPNMPLMERRAVHVPRCECGTSGVVCSCAE